MLVQRSRCKKGNPNACCPLILWQYNLVNTRKAITALCWCIYTNQVECKLVCFIFMFPICIHWPIQTRSIWRPQSCYIWMQLLCACRLTQSKLTAREQTLGWLLLSALSCPPGPAMCIVLRDKPRLLPWVKLSWPLQHSASVETLSRGPPRVPGEWVALRLWDVCHKVICTMPGHQEAEQSSQVQEGRVTLHRWKAGKTKTTSAGHFLCSLCVLNVHCQWKEASGHSCCWYNPYYCCPSSSL